MLSFLFIFLCNICLSQAAILQCDYETFCNDFVSDDNWGLTDGLHPRPIDHDHTQNTSTGHYLFYSRQSSPYFQMAEIKTAEWLQPSTDRAVCFRMWYYTPRYYFPFNIQFVQGDDEQLIRIAAVITGKDPLINDWAFINVTLPNEKIKIFIRTNMTNGPLAFDDISVDYCDEPHPVPPKVLYECDFESSCSNDFFSLPTYPYQWSILTAYDAIKIEHEAPSVDYTFGNKSGHYSLLPNSKIIERGNVGYLHLQKEFRITSKESYCLNFQYYSYGPFYISHLNVYLWNLDQSETVQILWPKQSSMEYSTCGIINLPIGYYSLLFRVDSADIGPRSFALDNISIISCDYPSTELSPYNSLLSFSCNFDNLTMCDMTNEDRFSSPTFNFTVFTGDTIPNPELGPTRDHTTNSSSGGFLYWNRTLPYAALDFGKIYPLKTIEQNFGMCVKFAYYVKSLAVNKNGTDLYLSPGGCYATVLWYITLDDSQGWQTVIAPVSKDACAETFYFTVNQHESVPVSVAFDDIEIDQCSSLIPTTTTSTSTTTTTSQIKTTTTSSSSTISKQRLVVVVRQSQQHPYPHPLLLLQLEIILIDVFLSIDTV
ncbi:unnamed protein product [Rotaria sp. Silwood2]|nr:unnamed protein product [Rotaria sp. Silwood2]CAF4118311.1 unnamed protein product [Rotaria sp. Silwood2]